MLTAEEEKFVAYWAAQRLRKKNFRQKFSISLPLIALAAVAFFINFLSGWYGKADKELRRHSSVVFVILIALIAIVIFVVQFSSQYKWEQNEADYQSFLQKRSAFENASKNIHQ